MAWNPPRDDGGSPITNYIVESRLTDKEEWIKLSATVKHTTFKACKLTGMKEYIFRISAENQFGVGEPAEHVPIIAKYSFGMFIDCFFQNDLSFDINTEKSAFFPVYFRPSWFSNKSNSL